MSRPVQIQRTRWYTLAELARIETSAILVTADVRADGGSYGATVERRIRDRGERVEVHP